MDLLINKAEIKFKKERSLLKQHYKRNSTNEIPSATCKLVCW